MAIISTTHLGHRVVQSVRGCGPLKMIFGTYSAQRAADDSPGPHTAAYACEIKDLRSQAFLQVRGPNRELREVGRVGLEPTTGGL
jgi:hypothetical protein